MKFKSITITFPRPLTEPQENQLCADMQAVVKSVREGVAKYRNKIDTHIEFKAIAMAPGGNLGINLIKTKLLELEANTYRYFVFEKSDTDACIYIFAHASEELSAINQTVKLPGIGKFKLAKGNLFAEEKLIRTLREITFKSIGYQAHEVRIEQGEYEKAV